LLVVWREGESKPQGKAYSRADEQDEPDDEEEPRCVILRKNDH